MKKQKMEAVKNDREKQTSKEINNTLSEIIPAEEVERLQVVLDRYKNKNEEMRKKEQSLRAWAVINTDLEELMGWSSSILQLTANNGTLLPSAIFEDKKDAVRFRGPGKELEVVQVQIRRIGKKL